MAQPGDSWARGMFLKIRPETRLFTENPKERSPPGRSSFSSPPVSAREQHSLGTQQRLLRPSLV